jgi:hypothetical protein
MQVALGPGGVVEAISPGKGYVDMSTVDSATSLKIAEVWVPLFFSFVICCSLKRNRVCLNMNICTCPGSWSCFG